MALIRLLHLNPVGEIVFREPTSGDVPPYTILSHTWGNEEVSYQDMEAGTARNKAGWRKIEFCAKQTAADGLKYFWIDTCCIDKKNSVELSAAINSMFRWYQKALRCYVYLSDVSISGTEQDGKYGGQLESIWKAEFRKSRWFTRGWTLQELIAPAYITFFSSGGDRLGDKLSLEEIVSEITSIDKSALRGDALSTFTIGERMSWAEHRQTTIKEDEIYSLLGIFNVSLPLIYGEGRENASRRLKEEIDKLYKG
jgi:hypothetical protein